MDYLKQILKEHVLSGTNPLEIITALTSSIATVKYIGIETPLTFFYIHIPIMAVIFIFNADVRTETFGQRIVGSFFGALIAFWKASFVLMPVIIIIGIARRI